MLASRAFKGCYPRTVAFACFRSLFSDDLLEEDLIDRMRMIMWQRGVIIFNAAQGNGGRYQCAPSLLKINSAAQLLIPALGPLRRYALLVDQEFYLRVEEERQPGGVLDGGAGQEAAMQAIAAMKAAARKARS